MPVSPATAHITTGWRTLVLPVIALLVSVFGSAIVVILLAGIQFTLRSLMVSMGLH